jgi:hypothetical protein
MIVELFTLENGVLIPTIHCHSLKSLKQVMDTFPDKYLKIYLYLFYKNCPDPKLNPFFNLPEEEKEEVIVQETGIDFSLDHPVITNAVNFCEQLYETPTGRMHKGMKTAMERVARFFETQPISTGRDGSLPAIIQAMSKFNDLRESFRGMEKDYLEEIAQTRGGSYTAYDMR